MCMGAMRKENEYEKSNEKGSWGGVALALSMVMAVGIFAGTGMEVKAEERWCVKEYDLQNVSSWDKVKNDLITVGSEDWNEVDIWLNEYLAKHQKQVVLFVKGASGDLIMSYYVNNPKGGYVFSRPYSASDTGINAIKTSIGCYNQECYILQKISDGVNSTSNVSYAPHIHSYSWVTVQDVNAEQDGIEEYRCFCGDVQERCVIPRYMAIVKGLYGAVKDAPQNGTATFDTGSAFTMTDYVIRKLAERADVTTVITFKYQNQSYKMTIPAGADYTSLLSDEDYFYGYFFFANAVGATIEAI